MPNKAEFKEVKRMTVAMRILHWCNAFAMIIAIATGFYIAAPYYQTFIADPAVDKYVMAWNRFGHFMMAIVFDITSLVIAYLMFFSRFDKVYKKLLPTATNIKEFGDVFVNLITLNRTKKFDSSHSDSFNTVYFTIFHLLLVWMLLTGFQMYVHGFASGTSSVGAWWPSFLHFLTDWTQVAASWMIGSTGTGANIMDVRISHHTTMWFIIVWVVFHIYYQVWRTIFWKEADIAIVIGGSKFVKDKKKD